MCTGFSWLRMGDLVNLCPGSSEGANQATPRLFEFRENENCKKYTPNINTGNYE
jgi:hypothetical protein